MGVFSGSVVSGMFCIRRTASRWRFSAGFSATGADGFEYSYHVVPMNAGTCYPPRPIAALAPVNNCDGQVLQLAGNRVTSLSGLSALSQLECLDAKFNYVERLPELRLLVKCGASVNATDYAKRARTARCAGATRPARPSR